MYQKTQWTPHTTQLPFWLQNTLPPLALHFFQPMQDLCRAWTHFLSSRFPYYFFFCLRDPNFKAMTEQKGTVPHFFLNRIVHFKRSDVAPTFKTRSCCTNFKTNNVAPKLELESMHGVKACSVRRHRSQKLRKTDRVASCGGGNAWCVNEAVKQSLTLSADDPGSTGLAADRRPLTLEKRKGNSLVSDVENTRSMKGAPRIWVFWALEYKHLLWKDLIIKGTISVGMDRHYSQ
jgi:type IV secretory pathway TraG/TraD family ATPase VirD4